MADLELLPAAPAAPAAKSLSDDEVLAHTAALWKYQDIPQAEPEPFPEYIQQERDLPDGRVIAARVRGKKHKHDGSNCDDWYEVANLDGITLLAVADGAGSRKFSRIGARESCRAALGYLLHNLTQDKPVDTNDTAQLTNRLAGLVQQAVLRAYGAVEAAFYTRAADLAYSAVLGRDLQFKDFSATLLLAVVVPLSPLSKDCLVVSCQVGDGMIAVINSDADFANALKLLGTPDSGDFSGETDFLTSSQMQNLENLQSRTRVFCGALDKLFLMTDGVSDDYFPNETELQRLYFDLLLNGVLPFAGGQLALNDLTPEQLKLFKQIPSPLAFPWVNDQNIKVPVQYTRRICEALGLSLADIWQEQTVLKLAHLELAGAAAENAAEQLKVWLDNYVERGSFDDRTLVIFTR